MKNVNEIIEAAKIGGGFRSDYALAKAIDRPQTVISSWRAGRRWPVLADTTQLAEFIGMEPAELFLAVEAMRTGDPTLIESAQRMLQKLQSVAAAAAPVALAMSLTSGDFPTTEPSHNAPTLHIMLNIE